MQPWESVDRHLGAKGVRYGAPTSGQTTGGNHVPTSLHPKGRGRDYGDRNSDCRAIVKALVGDAKGGGCTLVELFYSPTNTFLKNGLPIVPSKSLRDNHQDHVHVGVRAGANMSIPDAAKTAAILPDLPESEYSVEKMTTDLPVLRQGDNRRELTQHIKILQSLIKANGREVDIDGNFGPRTAAELKEWQGACGLANDGVVGPKTWRRLLCI